MAKLQKKRNEIDDKIKQLIKEKNGKEIWFKREKKENS